MYMYTGWSLFECSENYMKLIKLIKSWTILTTTHKSCRFQNKISRSLDTYLKLKNPIKIPFFQTYILKTLCGREMAVGSVARFNAKILHIVKFLWKPLEILA